jgi:predicted MPP superfamily phosphohydrolase
MRWWVLAIAIFLVIIAIVGYGFLEPFLLEVKQVTVTSPDLPEQHDGTRIVLLTDIHRASFFSQDRVKRLVERANALDPDLIVLGGDYVYAKTEYEASCFAELASLRAPLGVFAVLGNHDYGDYRGSVGGTRPAVEAIRDAGITLLDNEAVWIDKAGTRIRLGGVADLDKGYPELAPTVESTSESDYVILVSHNPDFAEELPNGAVDLVLSGHTHGGQVTFFGLWAPYLPSDYGQKYRTGLVVTEKTTVVVSNGIGTIFPPIRLFARPQIVEITLRSGPAADLQP